MTIWNGRSFLSQDANLFNLVLVRWDKHEQWSPWNTILLTRDEAEAHERLDDVTQVLDRQPSRTGHAHPTYYTGRLYPPGNSPRYLTLVRLSPPCR